MKIVQLSPLEETVPPKKYGGTELVVHNLCEELIKLGHEVFLLASGDSITRATLVPVFPKSIRKLPEARDMKIREALKFMGIGTILKLLKNIKPDIIHNHMGWRMLPFSPVFEVPFITTLHGPLDIGYQQFVYGKFSDSSFVSISDSQRKPFDQLNYAATVYNGIDTTLFPFSEKTNGYFAFLGRMSPEKGPVQAIKLAKKAGVKLVMAAKVDTVDELFFNKEVKPLIDGKQITFLGEIGHAGKVKLLKNAVALLAPIQWREPFGLFFVEAMACGTPVIAYERGSTKEIIDSGKTGFVVKTEKQFLAAIKQIGRIKRRDCRVRVENNFSSAIMAKNYFRVYEKLTA
jgi:glycosyltransferase involved in cell wall biosynthesis